MRPASMASRMSCAQGTSSQTIVHFSSVTARRIHSGLTPRSSTALLPDMGQAARAVEELTAQAGELRRVVEELKAG